ncbi:acylneuraminate cytidylyltransferase [Paenibacillus psychroresistens]|uniref:Acylneuraminate cytidylyltransferase n=1 Tax=Paenibacillus psychroresistens TaxID=1778678 RepID=A0A6B8RDS3_9BACL|nr:glycosyltransferase family protein [Paenibacillus psychroresistens]QGQ93526.1 acylneuraminate cytidylyltransferase [Paenibacillus psychroresistens]
MKTVAIIQARMGSTRLPGKVMMQLMDRSVLGHVINRLQQVKFIDEIIVATSTLQMDDVIEDEAIKCGVSVFRGSEQDVLSRYYEAAIRANAEIIVRVTSDCPLIDPETTALIIEAFLQSDLDYLTNKLVKTFPRGLDTEVFTMGALNEAYNKAVKPEQREHVTPYIYQNPDQFKFNFYKGEVDHSQHRWTLDTPEDWELISEIFKRLYHPGQIFSLNACLDLMDKHPELVEINRHIHQKELDELKLEEENSK